MDLESSLSDPWFIGLQWCAIVIIYGFVLIPLAMHLLGLSIYRCWVQDTAPEAVLTAVPERDAVNPDFLNQLRELGFEPFGVICQRVWFAGIYWTRSLRERVFSNGPERCVASVYKEDPDEPTRVTFETYFADNWSVLSGNFGSTPRRNSGTWVEQGIVTGELSELLDKHREAVGELRAGGHKLAEWNGLQGIVEQTLRTQRRMVSASRIDAAKQLLGCCLGVLVLIGIIAIRQYREEPGDFRGNFPLRLCLIFGSLGLLYWRFNTAGEARRQRLKQRHREIDAYNAELKKDWSSDRG